MAIIHNPSYWMAAIGACVTRLKSHPDLSRTEIDAIGSKAAPLSTSITTSNAGLSIATNNIDEYMRLIESQYKLLKTENNRLSAENVFYKSENARLTLELTQIKSAMNTPPTVMSTPPAVVTPTPINE